MLQPQLQMPAAVGLGGSTWQLGGPRLGCLSGSSPRQSQADLALVRLWDAAAEPGQPLSHSKQLDILQSLVPGRSPGHASRELLLQKNRREGDAATRQVPQDCLQHHNAKGEDIRCWHDMCIAVKDVHATEFRCHVAPGAPAHPVKRHSAICR